MLYKPAAVAANNRPVAQMPALAGHFELYISSEACEKVGNFEYTATATGTYEGLGGVDFSAVPTDLQVVVEGFLEAAAPVVVNVIGTNASDEALTGTATFTPPAYARNQTPNFPKGAAVDVVTPGAAKFKTVTNMTVNANGNAGSRLALWRLPVESSFSFVGCLDGFVPSVSPTTPVPVPCGMDGSRFVLPGRSEPNSLRITTSHFSLADGLARISGRNATVYAIRKANGVLLVERWVAGNCIFSVNAEVGSGSDVVTQQAEGIMGFFANFWAN